MAVKSFHGYTPATRLAPEWVTQFLVFQGGASHLRTGSLTGGGQVYGHEYGFAFEPVMQGYSTPIASALGGGQIAARPGFLTALFGGSSGQGPG